MAVHEFDRIIRKAHDYLYASAHIKTPEALQAEVAKIVMVLVAESESRVAVRPAFVADEVDWAKQAYAQVTKQQPEWNWGPIELRDPIISEVLGILSVVDFQDTERDFLGDALEAMRSTDAKRLGGQFFTDQRITELTVDLLDYSPDQHDFVDVCAGTGGFLIPASKRARAVKKSKNVVGIEIDSKISKLANSTLSHLATSAKTEVYNADSLAPVEAWPVELRRRVALGTHARLASNPPFGAKIKIREVEILRQYDLANKWSRKDDGWVKQRELVGRPPEILFIERNLQLAEPGVGRIGIVLPYQILSGPQLGFVRQWLLLHAKIIAIVDLPADTFQPWTGTKTSVVIAERLPSPLASLEDVEPSPVFMSTPEHIGHDRRGNPVRNSDGDIFEDISAVRAAFKTFSQGGNPTEIHSNSFVISSTDIAQDSEVRMNAAFYKPSSTGMKSVLSNLQNPNFDVVRLGDLVERVFCPGRFKRDYVTEGGIPFLGGSNISQFVLTTDKALSANDNQLPELLVEKDWILVTRSGSTGIVSRVPGAWSNYALSEHIIRIVPNPATPDMNDYLESYLRSRWGQRLLKSGIFGSVIDEITPEFVADLPVLIPKSTKSLKSVSEPIRKANEARDVTAFGLDAATESLEILLAPILT
jgi:type I restriction enzyme M protein